MGQRPGAALVLAGAVVVVLVGPASAQLVTCTVATEELVATARAELSSACSTKEMESQLLHFQQQVTLRLDAMQATIASLEAKLEERGKNVGKSFQPTILQDTHHWNGKAEEIYNQHQSLNEEPLHSQTSNMKKKRVFEYQWNVTGLWYKPLRSPSFYVSPQGYRMYLRLRPHSAGQSVFVFAGLTRGDYDQALRWPFTLQHRVQVVSGPEVMESRLWDPVGLCGAHSWQRPRTGDNSECVGFAFPRYALQRNAIVIKLMVFLE